MRRKYISASVSHLMMLCDRNIKSEIITDEVFDCTIYVCSGNLECVTDQDLMFTLGDYEVILSEGLFRAKSIQHSFK